MVVKNVVCKDCGKEFSFVKTNKYTRKYCDSCSKKRKKDYENLYMVTADQCDED